MKKLILIAYLIGQSLLAKEPIGDITLEDGTQYTGVKVLSTSPTDIVIKHDKGVGNIKFDQLTPELRQKFGYDPQAAAQADAAAEAKAEEAKRQKAQATAKAKEAEEIARNTRAIKAGILQVLKGGLLVQSTDIVISSSSRSIGGGGGVHYDRLAADRPKQEYGLIYLLGHPDQKNLSDADSVNVDAHRIGTHTYTTITGATRTVPKFKVIKDYP